MQRTNMLQLVLFAPQLLSTWRAKLLRDVPRNGRDALDLAGKLPLALKGLDIGLKPEHLLLDCAQAGGLHGRDDGAVLNQKTKVREPIEVKSGIRRRSKRCAFTFKRIDSGQDAQWRHLFLVGRERNPVDWGSLQELDACMWLGYVRRADYDAAVARAGRGRVNDVSVSPGSSRAGWASRIVHWRRFRSLTLEQWNSWLMQS
ncbi:hypothetical protein T484DRAFT_1757458 [Baffinella frigidus]|nr:hypothetical protein T484DRAFT_1757458 [Cryptophyta sp. CCMP2293]